MANTRASLRSDYCPIWIGIGVRLFSESVSAFAGIRSNVLLIVIMALRLGISVRQSFIPAGRSFDCSGRLPERHPSISTRPVHRLAFP